MKQFQVINTVGDRHHAPLLLAVDTWHPGRQPELNHGPQYKLHAITASLVTGDNRQNFHEQVVAKLEAISAEQWAELFTE